MKKLLFIILLTLLSACARNTMTGEQYCGSQLALKLGTPEYANCRLQYDQMQLQRHYYKASLWQRNFNNRQDVYVHPAY